MNGKIGMFLKMGLAAALGGAAVLGAPYVINQSDGAKNELQLAQTAPKIAPEPARTVPASKTEAISSYAPVVRKASGAVVNVYARSIQKGRVAIDPFWGAFRIPDRASQSQGSGVIVRDNGIIVTNNHVVANATELVVVLGDRREFPAKVITTDQRTDLAVLKIDTGGQKLPFLNYADTNAAEVGDQVLAIGNPFGVGQTVTSGIISALARTDVGITDYSFFIQTDASINPGNSGGALVDMRGNLVGINTAIFSGSGSSAGVGFAIPAEMVKRVVDGAVSVGRVVRTWSGVRGQSVTNDLANTMQLPRPTGVIVTEVYPNTAAAKAGLKRGDVIIGLSGVDVVDESGLKYLAATKSPGENIVFEYYRGGRKLTGNGAATIPPGDGSAPKQLSGRTSFAGLSVATLSPALADEKGLDPFAKGLIVTAVAQASLAERSGFQIGDLILEVNNEPIDSIAALERKLGTGQPAPVTIVRGGNSITARLIL